MRPVLDPRHDALASELAMDVRAFCGVEAASRLVLEQLAAVTGLGLWLVTRTSGDDWVVIAAHGDAYPVAAGSVFRWSDSFCARMVHGQGPRVAPVLADVPAYRDAPTARQLDVGCYVGVPLISPDGELLGTLCAIDPAPAPASLAEIQPFVELQARLLATVLSAELDAARQARRAEAGARASKGLRCPVLDAAEWADQLAAEQARSNRHASAACVVAVQVEPDVQAEAGRLLAELTRTEDVLAVTAPGCFALLCPETPAAVGQRLATSLHSRLQATGLRAAFGVAGLDPRERDLQLTWRAAARSCAEEAELLAT